MGHRKGLSSNSLHRQRFPPPMMLNVGRTWLNRSFRSCAARISRFGFVILPMGTELALFGSNADFPVCNRLQALRLVREIFALAADNDPRLKDVTGSGSSFAGNGISPRATVGTPGRT